MPRYAPLAQARREEPLGLQVAEPVAGPASGPDPERELLLADSVGMALLIVLDALAPAERVAFVLHDMFSVPFDDVPTILGRSPAATRQLASRARRRVRGAVTVADVDLGRQREIVGAFLAASLNGDFGGLLALLDPDVVVHADAVAVSSGADGLVAGADAVARTFAGRARAARTALLGGMPGLVWTQGGVPRMAFGFATAGGLITRIDLIADPEHLRQLDIAIAAS